MIYMVKNKWSTAHKCTYGNSIYDSKFEASYAATLDARKRAGEITGWKRQQRIPLIVNGYHVCDYIIDFIVEYSDGTKEFVECKGYAFEVWRLKWKLFEALFSDLPNVRLLVVKQKNNWTMRKIKKSAA